MCYITYTEKDLTQFLSNDTNKEVVIVDPLFTSLKASLVAELDTIGRPVEATMQSFNSKMFFDHFLSEARPIVVRGYAEDWTATKKWGDTDYLAD